MKICEVVRDLLPLYIDDACSQGSKETVEEHLKTCVACKKEYELMKYPAPTEKGIKDFSVVEELLLKDGKEWIETGVKQKILDKLLWLDIFLNVFFLSLGIGIKDLFLHARKLPWYGKVLSYDELSRMGPFVELEQFIGIILFGLMLLVSDVLVLILKKRKRKTSGTAITKGMHSDPKGIDFRTALEFNMIMSLFMKALYAVIMTAIGFLYLYNDLVSLCR